MRKVIKRKEPVIQLVENVIFLQEMIENPEKLGLYALLGKIRNNESKIPIDVNLLDFKIKIDKEIRKLNKKIYKKLGLDEVPDGIKK